MYCTLPFSGIETFLSVFIALSQLQQFFKAVINAEGKS
jgi:hypothetical protein